FFSSRRRHTRSKRDWSSDVCSSDLAVVLELLEELSIVGDEAQHYLAKCAVALDAGVYWIVVGLRVLVGLVLGHQPRDLFGDEPLDTISVIPLDVAEVIVEAAHNR